MKSNQIILMDIIGHPYSAKVELNITIEIIWNPYSDEVKPNNTNGNHVIQKFLNKLSSEKSDFIYNEIAEKCREIGVHKHGCCVLQRCYDNSTDIQKAKLTEKIIEHTNDFVRDQYGNYVIQFILKWLMKCPFLFPIKYNT